MQTEMLLNIFQKRKQEGKNEKKSANKRNKKLYVYIIFSVLKFVFQLTFI